MQKEQLRPGEMIWFVDEYGSLQTGTAGKTREVDDIANSAKKTYIEIRPGGP